MKHHAPIFIVEHLEPELWPWCLIEYASIAHIIPKERLWFTNVRKNDVSKLKKYGTVHTHSVQDLSLPLTKTCILDPRAHKVLNPRDASTFEYFIIGGILGDKKLNGRTEKELTQFLSRAQKRTLGKKQFSTDNAVYVVDHIVNGVPLSRQTFQDTLELHLNRVESVILPYRYPLVKGKPRIAPELITYLKKKETF